MPSVPTGEDSAAVVFGPQPTQAARSAWSGIVRVAYWPGPQPRLHPQLHGSMARVAPLLDLELIDSTAPPAPAPA